MSVSKQKEIISFFIKYPDLFRGLISSKYHLSHDQLKRYKSIIDWKKVSYNSNINWSVETIDEYKNSLDWSKFTINRNAFPDKRLLDVFSDWIDWYGVNKICGESIVNNDGIYWTDELISKYSDKIDFAKLSEATNVEWSEALIDKYIDKWNLSELASNESIPWSLDLFEKYLDESYFSYVFVQSNEALVSFEFVEKYQHLMDWHCVSLNPSLPWIEKDLLNYWSCNIAWTGIACNRFLFANDKNFYQKHLDKWKPIENLAFNFFSSNEAFPWSTDFIEAHKYQLDWNSLCANDGIIWDTKLIDRFAEFVEWGGSYPCELIDEMGNVISPYGGEGYESGLIENKSVPWSIDLLLKYENKIDFKELEFNPAVWSKAFKPLVNNDLIDLVMRII